MVWRLAPLELLRTFNCGIGMVLVIAPERAEAARAALEAAGETVYTIGAIAEGQGRPRVELENLEAAWPAAASPS